jgi:hypothetical protein
MSNCEKSSTPVNWISPWIAVSAAIVTFRICGLAFGFIFHGMPDVRFLLPVIYFLHGWDYILVPGVSLIAAVLVSRWAEHKLLGKGRCVGIVAGVLLTIIALLPFEVRFSIKPVMVSPLEIAISRHYSMETVEAIIDRYPRLINGTYKPWHNYNPLVDAALGARTNLVELLIRKGANVDAAVQRLQQINAESAVKLVLDCSNTHKSDPANGGQPIHTPSDTNVSPH